MTTFGFRALFMKYARMAGLDVDNRKISPHTFRHSFATHLAREKWPIKHVQDLLGHSCIQNTEIYLHLAKEDLVEAVDSLSSRKRRSGSEILG
jgi:site-specific recombinase XerD